MRCKALCLAAAALLAATPLRAEPFDPAELLSSGLPLIREWLTGERGGHDADHHVAAISSGSASLAFRAEGRSPLRITLADGRALAGSRPIGRYARGGTLEASWRELVLEASRRSTPEAVALAREWRADGVEGEELETAARIRSRLRRLGAAPADGLTPQALQAGGDTVDLRDLSDPVALEPALRDAARRAYPDLRITVPGGQARLGDVTIGSDETVRGHLLVLRGSAEVHGRLAGNIATVDGDVTVHPGGVIDGDVLTVGGAFRDAGGDVRGPVRILPATGREAEEVAEPKGALRVAAERAFGLTGIFLTLLALGFGLVLFGRPQLEVVADTVSFSFGRAFVVGLLAQMLVVPTFGMLVVGLVLSVVGVLLLPFAVIAFGLLLVVGVVGGILAVAHAMGETYTRRRLALGHAGSPNSYRYLLIGLTALCALWAAWVVFGWVPVAGTLILVTAALVTWLLGTVGLGATLLSHAGLRESFAGRLVTPEALTDEFLWATPQFGVPAVKRPPSRTPTPLR